MARNNALETEYCGVRPAFTFLSGEPYETLERIESEKSTWDHMKGHRSYGVGGVGVQSE